LPQAQLDTYSSDLFRSLAESDPELRLTALNAVLHKLNESLQTPTKDLVRLYAARIVRHATEVPFEDLRQAFSAFIEQVDKVRRYGWREIIVENMRKQLANQSKFCFHVVCRSFR
jgi:hypothetical protein